MQKGKRAVASLSDALSSKYVYKSDSSDLTKLSMEKDEAEGRKNWPLLNAFSKGLVLVATWFFY